jgi:hypothetical protein
MDDVKRYEWYVKKYGTFFLSSLVNLTHLSQSCGSSLICKTNLISLTDRISGVFRQLGLGYQQKIGKGISLTLSTLIDGRNFNQVENCAESSKDHAPLTEKTRR